MPGLALRTFPNFPNPCSREDEPLLKQLGEMGFKTYTGETSFLDVLLRAAGDKDGDKKLSLDEINVQRQLSRQAAAERERS